MARFFVTKEQILYEEGRPAFAEIIGSDVKHMRDVLRMVPGDSFTVCDSTGMAYACELERFSDGRGNGVCRGRILSAVAGDTEPRTPVILFQGIPKGDKMELIIQKNVELGVNQIVPVRMERTVVKFGDAKDVIKKTERWNRIAMEAAKQCGRLTVPAVHAPVSLREALSLVPCGALRLVPYENERDLRLKTVLREAERPEAIAFFIGPEGGISGEEISLLQAADFCAVSLGKRILRTETAGFAVLAAIRYELED